jgi:hypothetical protein
MNPTVGFAFIVVASAAACATAADASLDGEAADVGSDGSARAVIPRRGATVASVQGPAACAGAALAAGCPPPTLVPSTNPEVMVLGDSGSTLGIFDPSVVYPAGAPGGAMAYSSVPNQHAIRTRIALSNTGGAFWSYVAEANAPELALVASTDPAECPGGLCVGWLISEVSSLIYDPTDPNPNARWKLFAHRYLAEANDRLHYALGTITLQTAKDPQGPWTPPRKLFGVPSSSPYTLAGTQVDVSKLPGMADCRALTEPSALWQPDRIDVALGCVYNGAAGPKIRVHLLRSVNHGASWSAVAPLLDPGSGDCLPGTSAGASVNAADLFLGPDGGQYLSASSSDPGYHGCAIYRFDNPATGHLERTSTSTGAPRVLRSLAADTGQFSGACSWSGGGGGYFMIMGFFNTARPFRIVRVGVPAP